MFIIKNIKYFELSGKQIYYYILDNVVTDKFPLQTHNCKD